MDTIIRSTVTITISESWTIVWTAEDHAADQPQPSSTAIVQDQAKTKEECDATFQTAVNAPILAIPSASDSIAQPTQPDAIPPKPKSPKPKSSKPKAGNQGKRSRRRRVAAVKQGNSTTSITTKPGSDISITTRRKANVY